MIVKLDKIQLQEQIQKYNSVNLILRISNDIDKLKPRKKENSISLQQQNVKLNIQYYKAKNKEINLQENTFKPSYTYTDQEFDSESNLMYYDARYYDVDLKRFLSNDLALKSIGNQEKLKEVTNLEQEEYLANSQHLNSYAYVKNNPIVYVDPSGEFGNKIFNNPLSFLVSTFSIGMINASTMVSEYKYPEATRLFRRSVLTRNPGDLYLNQNDSLARKVMNSKEYGNAIDNIIGKYSNGNIINFTNEFDRKAGSFRFTKGDLGLAIGRIAIKSIHGKRINKIGWVIDVNLSDNYNYEWSWEDKAASVPNNMAVGLESEGVVSDYKININIKDVRKSIKK